VSRRLDAVYGGGPVLLLGMLAAFAVSGAALVYFVQSGPLVSVALWFGGAIVLHDLVLFPAYSLLDRGAARSLGGAINYLRVPTLLSALLFLVWFPLILGLSEERFRNASGMSTSVYLGRWLAVSAALFAISAVVVVVRRLRAR